MVLIDLLNAGLAQTLNLSKNKINHSICKVQQSEICCICKFYYLVCAWL